METDENIKFDIKAEKEDLELFISALKKTVDMKQTSSVLSNDKSHFDIFKFMWKNEKCTIVYDTKAEKISLSAKASLMELLKSSYIKRNSLNLEGEFSKTEDAKPGGVTQSVAEIKKVDSKIAMSISQKTNEQDRQSQSAIQKVNGKQQSQPAMQKVNVNQQTQSATQKVNGNKQTQSATQKTNGNKPAQPSVQKINGQNKPTQPALNKEDGTKPFQPIKPDLNTAPKAHAEKNSLSQKKSGKITAGVKTERAAAPSNKTVSAAKEAEIERPIEYKNGYSVKKYPLERLEAVLKALKSIKGVTHKLQDTTAQGKPEETKTYCVTDSKGQKLLLRYMPQKLTLQMQGKRSSLFSEVQVLISKDSDFKSAVSSHIELTGEAVSVANMQRQLKKILPDAFDFLNEQSKIDLTIGLIDITNNETKLADYSSLLTPPYRGLEKFISDLQKAQSIEVKMIGQAFEKDDKGNYLLKSGYRKRIDSVIYAEVMSALYTEYFSRRNFYSHSDNSDESASRIITDKQEVKVIFERLMGIINYNSKKLKEIRFSVK